jgi:alkanesulfonate monooxygenase SsuD/methylene tetrahydromethanopterin reductase-like flavin-dependent oxidoreductase (luciferase family)
VSTTPKIGYLSQRISVVGDADARRLVARAEAASLDHLAVGDHVSFRTGAGADGLLAASAILAVSDQLAVNTAVYLLPLRHPVLVARQLADLAHRAPGRLTFGVGIGGEDPHELEICGIDPKTRGRRMEEHLQVVRGLLTGEPFDFAGDLVSVDQAQIVPAAVPPIPIVVGGRSDAAIRRAGRLGDGWFGIWVSPDRYGRSVALMREAASEAGREEPAWTNALNVWCGVDTTATAARAHVAPRMEEFYGIPYDRFERWSPAGTPAQVAEQLVPYVAAGCSVFNLILNGPSLGAELDAAAEIRERILAATG